MSYRKQRLTGYMSAFAVMVGVTMGGVFSTYVDRTSPINSNPAFIERPPIENMRCPVCSSPKSDPFDGDRMYLKNPNGPDPRVMFCKNKHTWRGDTGEQIRLVP